MSGLKKSFDEPDLRRVLVLLETLPEPASEAKCDWLAAGTRHSKRHTEKKLTLMYIEDPNTKHPKNGICNQVVIAQRWLATRVVPGSNPGKRDNLINF